MLGRHARPRLAFHSVRHSIISFRAPERSTGRPGKECCPHSKMGFRRYMYIKCLLYTQQSPNCHVINSIRADQKCLTADSRLVSSPFCTSRPNALGPFSNADYCRLLTATSPSATFRTSCSAYCKLLHRECRSDIPLSTVAAYVLKTDELHIVLYPAKSLSFHTLSPCSPTGVFLYRIELPASSQQYSIRQARIHGTIPPERKANIG